MKIILDKEAVDRMLSTMGETGFQKWIAKMKKQGNEVVIEGYAKDANKSKA